MPEGSLRVIAHVMPKADSVEQVRTILSTIVEPTRRESGCISYSLLEQQSEPAQFSTIEEWTSVEAEQAHFSTPHILSALQQLSGLLAAEPDIRRYRIVK